MKRREFIQASGIGGVCLSIHPKGFFATEVGGGQKKKVDKIKIGQIGISHSHASARLKSLKLLPDVFEIVGVVDDRGSNSTRYAGDELKPYEGQRWMTESELLSYPGLQAVLVETANTELVPTALRCMDANLAISMDKPGGEDLALFGKLLKGCASRKIPFQIAHMLRGNPAVQFCQKAIREDWLGDIFEIQASMSHNYGDRDGYQSYLSGYKGGIMFILGSHLIDVIVSMLGRPDRVTPFLQSTRDVAHNAINNGLAVLEFPHAMAWINTCDLEVDGLKNRRLKVCGAKGTIEMSPFERFDGEPLQLTLRLSEGNGEYAKGTHVVDFGLQKDRYIDQLLEFAQVIRGETVSPYTAAHDYLTQEVHLAASGYIPWSG